MITISIKLLGSNSVINEVKQLRSSLKVAFKKVKNEFSEHLESVNKNTNEIQNNYEFLCELDAKMDKLTQRVDEIQMFMEHQKNGAKQVPKIQLTDSEKEVFMALYTNEGSLLSYSDIAAKLDMSEILVRNYINNLITKGVPVERRYKEDRIALSIDPEFRHLQATENLLGVSETEAKQFV